MRTVNGKTPTSADLIRMILVKQFDGDIPEDRFYIYAENMQLPTDKEIICVIKFDSSSHLGSTLTETATVNGLSETSELNTVEQLTVTILSRNDSALERKEEFFLALKSTYAIQLAEKYAAGIFPQGEFADRSRAEGSAIIRRFDMPVTVHAWYSKIRVIEYYNDIPLEVRTEDMITTVDTTHLPQEE